MPSFMRINSITKKTGITSQLKSKAPTKSPCNNLDMPRVIPQENTSQFANNPEVGQFPL